MEIMEITAEEVTVDQILVAIPVEAVNWIELNIYIPLKSIV